MIALLGISPNGLFGSTQKDLCAKMFILVLFIIERKSKYQIKEHTYILNKKQSVKLIMVHPQKKEYSVAINNLS